MPRAVTGARAKLYMDGKEVGYATGVNAQESITQVPIEVLGDIDAKEIEPIGRAVTMSASAVRIVGESLRSLGFWPKGGTGDVINFAGLTAELHDEVNDEPIAIITGLKPENLNWRVDRAGLATYDASFRGIRMYDHEGF